MFYIIEFTSVQNNTRIANSPSDAFDPQNITLADGQGPVYAII